MNARKFATGSGFGRPNDTPLPISMSSDRPCPGPDLSLQNPVTRQLFFLVICQMCPDEGSTKIVYSSQVPCSNFPLVNVSNHLVIGNFPVQTLVDASLFGSKEKVSRYVNRCARGNKKSFICRTCLSIVDLARTLDRKHDSGTCSRPTTCPLSN